MLKCIMTATMLIVSVSAIPAMAQTFTYQSQGDAPVTVGGVGPDGTPYGGAYMTGKGTTSFADGTKSTYNYTCVSNAQPPRDAIFMSHMTCDVTASDGNFSAIFGCNTLDPKTMDTGCVGGLMGKTGRYAGKRGSLTNLRKGNTANGTGQWYQ